MNTCKGFRLSGWHTEICYAGTDCPACELLDRISGLEEKLSGANRKFQEMDDAKEEVKC